MDYINDININEAVLHILDANAEEPVLSEYSIELAEDQYKILWKHINKCLKSDELRFAKFNEGRGILKEITQEYLNQESDDLIEVSKEMARQLFMIMKGNCNISSSDLIVASIMTDQGPMIAILKMDYISNFTHEIKIIDEKIGVDLVKQVAALPGSGQKIQKAAFIKPIREGEAYNLMILDNQITKDEYGANFFTNTYLNCTYVTNERDMTRDFIKASENWVRKYVNEDAAKAEEVRKGIKEKLKEEDTLKVDEISAELFPEDQEQKESFAREIKMHCNSEEIQLDKVYIDKKLKRVRLNIDKEIDLYINEEAYKDKSKFEVVRNGDGSINLVVKNVINYIEK